MAVPSASKEVSRLPSPLYRARQKSKVDPTKQPPATTIFPSLWIDTACA
jgi:hypothetical protein